MLQFSIYSLPPLFVSGLFLAIGIFIYYKNRNAVTNITFSMLCLCTFIWLFGYFLLYSTKDKTLGLIIAKFLYVGVTYIPIFFYHFVISFLKIEKENKILLVSYGISTFFAFITLFTNLLVNDLHRFYWGYQTKAGIFHTYYLIFYFTLYFRCLCKLYLIYKDKTKSHASISLEVNRIKYVLAAFTFATFGGLDFIPNYGFEFYPFGFIFVAIAILTFAYAIVRHQLLEIEVVIKKTLVFAGLFGAVYAVFALFAVLGQDIFRSFTGGNRWVSIIPSVIVITLMLRPLENFLVNITNKYLFQKKYDYKELLKIFTSEVLTVLDLNRLVTLTVDKLVDIIKLTSSSLLLLDEETQEFKLVAAHGVKDKSMTLLKANSLISFFDMTHEYILKTKIEKEHPIPDEIKKDLNNLNAELMIPLVLHNKLVGILSLGKKRSDEDYTQDDMDILLPLASTLSIAISNAELLDQLSKTQAEAAQREKMAVIGTLSAGINHEICNPLGIARGQCEAFLLNIRDGLYKGKDTSELLTRAKGIMEKVIKETDRATAITKKLSSFAKPAKGEMEVISVEKEVDEVLGLVGYELKLEKIEIVKKFDKDLYISVDKKQIQEIFFNLIRNAGQAIGEKGKITISGIRENSRVFIDIQDTGHGIPETKVKELFNPFFTTKDPGKGTGLGLFIVRQVVERNGGMIYLKETKVGEGTTFRLEFPVAMEAHV